MEYITRYRKEVTMAKVTKILVLMLVLAVSVSLVACGDAKSKSEKPKKEDYVGAWECVAIMKSDQSYPEDFELAVKETKKYEAYIQKTYPESVEMLLNYLFLEDEETGVIFLMDKQYKGSWELTDNSILFFPDDSKEPLREYKIDLKNNRLVYEVGDAGTWIYKKEKKKKSEGSD